MHGRFQLKTLGLPALVGPDGTPVRFRVRKHLALLVFLAVERRTAHDRGRLVDLLWPRVPPHLGRHSLATALSLLRTVLGSAALPASRGAVRLGAANLVLDLDRLEAGDILGAEGEGPLEVDGFLRGFDLPDAPEFELWKEREHARRLPAIHAGLLTLIDHARRRGSHDEIMSRAGRLLALDDLAEEGVRATMEALVLAGDRLSALRVFEQWKARLALDLEAEPSSLLEGMAAQLRKRGWEPRGPAAMPPVPAEQWRDRKFVGRAREYKRLYEAWEATHQSRPRHVLIEGDSGVGKSTLAQRLVTAAGLEGASVSRVQCYHLEQRLPYAAIGGLVAGLLGRPGVAAAAPSALAEVARIVPQVKEHFPGLPAPRASEGETARLLFAEGVMDMLTAVMDERPLLLVLDDLHCADEASLAVLHLILRRLDQGRYMVVLATRTSAEADTGQARRIREGVTRLAIERLQLEPLSEEETAELLQVILEEDTARPRPPERRALVRASRGFPMALELLTQDWRANGSRSLALSLGAMTPDFGAGAGSDAVTARMAERVVLTLSHNARQVLSLAALLGSRISDLSFFALVDLSFGQTVEGVSELAAKRILRSVGPALEFINELVRAHVYREIPAAVRTALHAAIADRLLSQEALGQSVPGLEIAWHLMRSGRVADATPRLFRGAAEAKNRGAPDEAVLALESGLPQLDAESQTRARVVLADLHQELGRWADSLQVLAEIRQPTRDLELVHRVLDTHARWQLGETGNNLTRLIDEQLAIARSRCVATPIAFLLAARMAVHLETSEAMRRVLSTGSTLELGREHGDRLPVIVGMAMLHYNLRELEVAKKLADTARREAAAQGRADSTLVRTVAGQAAISIVLGDYESASDLIGQAIKLAERLDNETLLGELYSTAALSAVSTGAYRQATDFAARAAGRLHPERATSYLVHAIANGALASGLLDEREEALRAVATGDQITDGAVTNIIKTDWTLAKADVLWVTGRRSEALKTARRVIDTSDHALLPPALAGKYARWTSRCYCINQDSATNSAQIMDDLVLRRARYDAIDRVDIISAAINLSVQGVPFSADSLNSALAEALQPLSQSTVQHLARIGVLPGAPASTW